MLLMDPSPSSVGEYTLIADEYTGVVTVGKRQLNTINYNASVVLHGSIIIAVISLLSFSA